MISSATGSRNWNGSSSNNPSTVNSGFDTQRLLAASLALGNREFTHWQRGLDLYAKAMRPAKPLPARQIWQKHNAVLRDYGGPLYASSSHAPLVLAVPSLVNRADILDLLPGRSLLRHLARRHRVWLLDWQEPGEAEARFSMSDYVTEILLPAIAQAQATGRPVYLLGHCLGGTLALAAAQLSSQPLDGLMLMSAPWDFDGYSQTARAGLAQWVMTLTPWLMAGLALPPDMLQILFNALQPLATYEKFRKLGAGEAACDDLFVAIEDWLNNGVPLVAPAARQCLGDWFGQNATAKGQWRIGDTVIDPALVKTPALVIAPQNDTLVPNVSAAALGALLPRATLQEPPLGHIGMVVGRQAENTVWKELDRWIETTGQQA